MKKTFGRFSRNEFGEIQVSLEDLQGELYLDLRIYSRPVHQAEGSRAEPETILVPVRMLRDLCEILERTKEDLVKERLVDTPTPEKVITTQTRKPVFVLRAEQPRSQPDRRREPRVPVRLPVACRFLSAPKDCPPIPVRKHVTGETRDLSRGGAQVWLPEQFPIGAHLAVFMRTGELTFRAQTEVKGVATNPEHGNYRHNLQWLVLDPQARTGLLEIMKAAARLAMSQA